MIIYFVEASSAFGSSDAYYLLDHFDTFFSVIENADKIPLGTLMRAMEILQNTARKFGEVLDNYLKQRELVQLSKYLNLTKMLMYLMTSLVRAIDGVVKDTTNEPNQKKTSKKQSDRADVYDWNDRRYKVLTLILNLMQLPLEKLWTVSIAEEEFVK